jgi:hypothetical protein
MDEISTRVFWLQSLLEAYAKLLLKKWKQYVHKTKENLISQMFHWNFPLLGSWFHSTVSRVLCLIHALLSYFCLAEEYPQVTFSEIFQARSCLKTFFFFLQLILITGFHVCKFSYSLKFTCNPQNQCLYTFKVILKKMCVEWHKIREAQCDCSELRWHSAFLFPHMP